MKYQIHSGKLQHLKLPTNPTRMVRGEWRVATSNPFVTRRGGSFVFCHCREDGNLPTSLKPSMNPRGLFQ